MSSKFFHAFAGGVQAKVAGGSSGDTEALADHIVILGDSIMARTHYTTQHTNQNERPAGFISPNASDKLRDIFDTPSAFYRRYDNSACVETPSSGWQPTLEYGGDAARNSERLEISIANASVSFTAPANQKYFNFVGNFATANVTSATIDIAEGDNKVKIWDIVNQKWVEANGYSFNPNSTLYGGGTIWYGRRYFKKYDGVTSAITITITKNQTTQDFNYWGWEYANEPFNVIVCEARGGHVLITDTSTNTGSQVNGLSAFQDRAFNSLRPMPKLVILEIPLINMLFHFEDDNPAQMWNRVNTFVWGNDPFSLKSKTNDFANTQLVIFTAHLTSDDVNPNGTIKTRVASDLQTYSKKAYHDEIITQLNLLNHPYLHVVDLHQQFLDYGEANYGGNYYTAISGGICSSDRIHLNDNGAQVYYDILEPTLSGLTL